MTDTVTISRECAERLLLATKGEMPEVYRRELRRALSSPPEPAPAKAERGAGMKPQRIQLSRKKGFSLQAASLALNGLPAVKVDRTTKWGNPYVPGMIDPDVRGINRVMVSSDCVVKAFRGYALRCLEVDPKHFEPLRGKNLACWCGGGACHADVLLELANSPDPAGAAR